MTGDSPFTIDCISPKAESYLRRLSRQQQKAVAKAFDYLREHSETHQQVSETAIKRPTLVSQAAKMALQPRYGQLGLPDGISRATNDSFRTLSICVTYLLSATQAPPSSNLSGVHERDNGAIVLAASASSTPWTKKRVPFKSLLLTLGAMCIKNPARVGSPDFEFSRTSQRLTSLRSRPNSERSRI